MLKLFANDTLLGVGFKILVKYCRSPAQIINLSAKEASIFSVTQIPFLLSNEAGMVNSFTQMAIDIVKSNSLDNLLCKDPKSLELLMTLKDNDDVAFITAVDKILAASTFLSAPHIDAIDVILYPRANQILRANSKFPNACRWCLHIQELPDMKEILTELKLILVEKPKEEEKKEEPKKREKKEKQKKEAKKKVVVPEFSRLDLRVGKILKVEAQADSEKLYNEEIDIGNGEIRHISSGLRPFLTLEQMLNKNVIVFCNLKSRKLAGKESYGMVLCASNADHTLIELLNPAEGSMTGDTVKAEGIEKGEIEDLNISKKNNPWEVVQAQLSTNDNLELTYKGVALKTDKGLIKASTLKTANIS